MPEAKIIYRDRRCTVFQSALYQTNTTWLESEHACLLVDPNWLPDEVMSIQAYARGQLQGRQLFLGITHSDYDHIIGVGAFPEARIVASRALAERQDPANELAEIQSFDDKNYCVRAYPVVYPSVDVVVDAHAPQVQLNDWGLHAWPSPGHNPDGMILYDPLTGTLILGDYLSPLEFPFVYHGFSLYQQTLDRLEGILKECQPRLIIPGHGEPYTSVTSGLTYVQRDRAYLAAVAEAKGEEGAFPWKEWSGRFPFPQGLLAEHRKNLAVWRRENGLES
ncbi:MAG: MBL fold metallo-hydrolase [Lewinella sp.]|nr:MBL fold metallo-hydrolase [Lewinella sp.]